MKLAIISVTSSGKELAKHLKEKLNKDPSFIEVKLFHKEVKNTLKNIFSDYDAILGIMATGIMVRSVCGLLKSKTSDPAILVMDESSKHVISLISGHLGGANQLAIEIGKISGADPVITTATDVNDMWGIDALARKYYWEIENPDEILFFNKAILNGDKIGLLTDLNIDYIFKDPEMDINYYKIENDDLNDIPISESSSLNIKPYKDSLLAVLNKKKLLMKPKKIVVGIGSRKGVSSDQVIQAIENVLKILDLPINRIDEFATADIKSKEKGILDCAGSLNINLNIVPLNDIKTFESSQCSFSEFVEENFGVGGICEPAALLTAGAGSRLILKKTAYNGVTVAIAVI